MSSGEGACSGQQLRAHSGASSGGCCSLGPRQRHYRQQLDSLFLASQFEQRRGATRSCSARTRACARQGWVGQGADVEVLGCRSLLNRLNSMVWRPGHLRHFARKLGAWWPGHWTWRRQPDQGARRDPVTPLWRAARGGGTAAWPTPLSHLRGTSGARERGPS